MDLQISVLGLCLRFQFYCSYRILGFRPVAGWLIRQHPKPRTNAAFHIEKQDPQDTLSN
jgi:hypothetical protein